jgi:hypothetical protein
LSMKPFLRTKIPSNSIQDQRGSRLHSWHEVKNEDETLSGFSHHHLVDWAKSDIQRLSRLSELYRPTGYILIESSTPCYAWVSKTNQALISTLSSTTSK